MSLLSPLTEYLQWMRQIKASKAATPKTSFCDSL
jgi:hypothetical protein